ncbi:sensor histidine kinase [Alkalihalobacterium bogoriense]|uniref:sensor histidine kinase n=1 Tax=Alkalihalobacterium bogoriense TaxID=246272 RepID=UPI00047A4549|nr:sensor histidine kinase [Alkalihalobacterium bogoriense]
MKIRRKYNNLRNQILVVYLVAMVIVLMFVSLTTYSIVSELIKDKAEKQIQQTALQATGRIDSLYQQLKTVSIQAATDSKVQQILFNHTKGEMPSFKEKQTLMDIVNKIQSYTSGVTSIEVYTNDYKKLIPLDDVQLTNRIDEHWIEEAERAKGGLVWIGNDPNLPNHFLAIRQVRLINESFKDGGYLLMQIDPHYFAIHNERKSNKDEFMILRDKNERPITSSYPGDIDVIFSYEGSIIPLHENDYIKVRQTSSETGWELVILTPIDALLEGVSDLRTATFISGVFGFFLFLVISYFLSTMITRPIFKLTRAMKKRRKGELLLNLEHSSTLEINELNTTYNQMVEEINHLIQVVYEKEIIRSRTELKALQSQINPHFLYNTLNAIYWSLDAKGDQKLAELIITMSDLFRYTIDNDMENEWVTLQEEISHIEKYMEIMNFRLDCFTWDIHIPNVYETVKIPKLLIQPLIENAIIHGVANKVGKGKITMTVQKSKDANTLQLFVTDDGKGMEQSKVEEINKHMSSGITMDSSGSGIGLSNVYKRLKLYYTDVEIQPLIISSEKNIGTCCTFELPLNGGVGDE